ASSGIGLEMARLFAVDGYDLIVTARRVERLQQLADELIKDHGIAVRIIQMDIAQPFAGTALWQAISDINPDIEVLVNNAGFGDSGDFAEEPPESIERMIHLNISTLTSLTRHALPGMIARKRGKILNVASLAGFQPGGPGMSVYYATKSYVLSFSRGIRRELYGTGVGVTALCPGATRTEFEATAKAQNTLLFKRTKPMDASAVARAGYQGMQRGCGVVIPGLLNKFLAISVGFSPTAIALELNRYLLSERR
ncbi:MAG TPA: SDR family oxidoreductase, partial [Gallionellaceae bacterium]|nr:SDR family oxidoreductase [Gallionellaceae bacterium]